jgi:hypothetical protein
MLTLSVTSVHSGMAMIWRITGSSGSPITVSEPDEGMETR